MYSCSLYLIIAVPKSNLFGYKSRIEEFRQNKLKPFGATSTPLIFLVIEKCFFPEELCHLRFCPTDFLLQFDDFFTFKSCKKTRQITAFITWNSLIGKRCFLPVELCHLCFCPTDFLQTHASGKPSRASDWSQGSPTFVQEEYFASLGGTNPL